MIDALSNRSRLSADDRGDLPSMSDLIESPFPKTRLGNEEGKDVPVRPIRLPTIGAVHGQEAEKRQRQRQEVEDESGGH